MLSNRYVSVYLGLFIVSLATLTLEISLTRFFSVSKWYHFAFMVVSIALFGIGVSGSFLSMFQSRLERNVHELRVILSFSFSLTCAFSIAITNLVPFDPFRFAWDPIQVLNLAIHFITLSVPFFFSGLLTAVILAGMANKVNKIYFSTMMGSGVGSLIVTTVLSPISCGWIIVFVSSLGFIATFIFTLNLPRKKCLVALASILISTTLLFTFYPTLEAKMSPYKSLKIALTYPNSQILYTGWNSFSRVDVFESPYVRYAPGLSYEYQGSIPSQLGLTVDGDSLTAITYYDGAPSTLNFTGYLPMALPYHLSARVRMNGGDKVLIIYPGGGLEVLAALYHNASEIVAVEINPLLIEAVRDRFGDFAGNIYEDDKVSLQISEGRSFVKSTNETYDLIQLSIVGNVAVSSTGVYALSEDYLYTVEAMQEYYMHLKADGLLCITRWLLPPPREELRIVSLAVSALEAQGVDNPDKRIAAVRGWGTFTLLVKQSDLTQSDSYDIRQFCSERKFDIVYLPEVSPSEVNRYNRFPQPYYYEMVKAILSSKDRKSLYQNYLFDITPVNDEKPFFYHFYRLDKIVSIYESMGNKWQPFVEGAYLVPVVLIQALVLSVVFILMPLLRFKRLGAMPGRSRLLAYFLLLGLGYMFIEIVFIQKFILFLGHPVYAVSTVLFSLLTFSGLGSYFSGRLKCWSRRTLIFILLLICSITVVYTISLPILMHELLGQGLAVRLLILASTITPLAFLMGMPFPLGISLTNKRYPALIPWTWAVNGCASVLGSILPVTIALFTGFSTVLLLGGVIYLAAAGAIQSLPKS
jgi:spermidine synthase